MKTKSISSTDYADVADSRKTGFLLLNLCNLRNLRISIPEVFP